MPSLVPDSDGTRHEYVIDAKVTFSMVSERGSVGSLRPVEEDTAALVEAFKEYLAGSVLAAFTDGFTVEATATRKDV